MSSDDSPPLSTEAPPPVGLSASQHALLKALGEDSSAGDLVEIGFRFMIARPLSELIQPEEILGRVTRLFDADQAGELIETHLPEAISRGLKRARESRETPQEWLTAEVDAELRSWAMRPIQLSTRQVRSWVHHEVTEHIMRDLIREILERFIQKAKPGGQGGGLLGMASRGALGWASKASKGALSGLGDQFEDHLKGLISSFIQSSMHALLERLSLILTAPEVALKLGKARLELYENLLSQPLSTLAEDVAEVEWREWAEIFPQWVDYTLNRPAVREALLEEAHHVLTAEGHRPLSAFLGGEEKIEILQREVRESLTPHLIAWSHADELIGWVSRHLHTDASSDARPDDRPRNTT